MTAEVSYNPLNKKNLGISVADAMLAREVNPLPLERAFEGAGIYAIYYVGDFPLYASLARLNRNERYECPIYMGKAVPAGARQGNVGLDASPGRVLFSRIRKHCRSIEQASNLDIKDFYCRYLVVEDIWIPLGESLLIQQFRPVWNQALDGFGNNDPGGRRYNQQRSAWDIVHPGRDWAIKCADNPRSKKEIEISVKEFLENRDL